MKQIYFSFLLLLAIGYSARAMPEGALYMYSRAADTIYDVRVDSIDEHKIAFSVVDVLRGKPVEKLVLRPMDFNIKKGDELMILSCDAWRKGEYGDAIGDLDDGQLGWIDARVFRADGKVYVFGSLFDPVKLTPIFDRKFGVWECLTLDHFKQMLTGKPYLTWDVGAGITIKKAADYGGDVVIATFSPPSTWKPVAREPDSQAMQMQVINAMEGSFSGTVPVIFPFWIGDKRPEPETQYIAFFAKWGDGNYRIHKLLPATKENVDATKAAIAAK